MKKERKKMWTREVKKKEKERVEERLREIEKVKARMGERDKAWMRVIEKKRKKETETERDKCSIKRQLSTEKNTWAKTRKNK